MQIWIYQYYNERAVEYCWQTLKLHFISKTRWQPQKSKTKGNKENRGRKKCKNHLNVYYEWYLLLHTITKLIRLCYRNGNFTPRCPLYGISRFVQCCFHYGEKCLNGLLFITYVFRTLKALVSFLSQWQTRIIRKNVILHEFTENIWFLEIKNITLLYL